MSAARRLWALVAALACLGAAPAAAQSSAVAKDQAKDLVRAELVSEAKALVPGATASLGIRLTMKPGWHVYWRNPGDSGLPPEMAWRLPEGVSAGAFQWPVPERIPVQHLMNYGYEGETVLLVPVSVPGTLAPGREVTLGGTLTYLVCEEICIPGSAELSLILPVVAVAEPDPDKAALFTAARQSLPVEAPVPVRFVREGERVVLTYAATGLAPEAVSAAAFFPYAETALDNAAPQDLRIDAPAPGWIP